MDKYRTNNLAIWSHCSYSLTNTHSNYLWIVSTVFLLLLLVSNTLNSLSTISYISNPSCTHTLYLSQTQTFSHTRFFMLGSCRQKFDRSCEFWRWRSCQIHSLTLTSFPTPNPITFASINAFCLSTESFSLFFCLSSVKLATNMPPLCLST